MSFYDDHIKAVKKRWQKKRALSGMTEKEFDRYARKTLLGYGWNEAEIDFILK